MGVVARRRNRSGVMLSSFTPFDVVADFVGVRKGSVPARLIFLGVARALADGLYGDVRDPIDEAVGDARDLMGESSSWGSDSPRTVL